MTALAQDLADVLALADAFPELNLSNYGQDEVDRLNQWGIDMHLALRTHGPALAALVEDAARWQAMRELLVGVDFEPDCGGCAVAMFECMAERVSAGPVGADGIADAARNRQEKTP